MASTIFGYLLFVADISLFLFASSQVYRAFHPRSAANVPINYMGWLQSSEAGEQAASNAAGQAWGEARHAA